METRLKEIRKAKGFKSAKAFAESIGMQEKTYRNYEQGVRNLYLDVACELCTALGCTLDELVGREPRRSDEKDSLSSEERLLIDCYRRMTTDMRRTVIETAMNFAALSGSGVDDGGELLEKPLTSTVF